MGVGSGTVVTYSPGSTWARVRPGTDVDDGMVAHGAQPRIVPASPQLVAAVVVDGAAEPDRPRLRPVLQHDEYLLQVGLVVVRPVEGGPPVVHPVEVEVVQDDPATLPDHTPVVDMARVGGLGMPVLDLRGRRRAARDGPAQEQRGVEEGIDQAGEEAHPREPSGLAKGGPTRALAPADELQAVERPLDQLQEQLLPWRGRLRPPDDPASPRRRSGSRGGCAARCRRGGRRRPGKARRPRGRTPRPGCSG